MGVNESDGWDSSDDEDESEDGEDAEGDPVVEQAGRDEGVDLGGVGVGVGGVGMRGGGMGLHGDIPLHQPMSSYFSYIDDEEYGMLPEYSGLNKAKIYPGLWNPLTENPYVGLFFRDKEMLIKGIGEWAISNNVHLKVYLSNKIQYGIWCKLHEKDEGTNEDISGNCLWRLRATYNIGSRMFKVTKYKGPHICRFPQIPKYHLQLTSTFVARYIENGISVNPLMRIPDVQEFVHGAYKKKSCKRAWMDKQKAIAAVF